MKRLICEVNTLNHEVVSTQYLSFVKTKYNNNKYVQNDVLLVVFINTIYHHINNNRPVMLILDRMSVQCRWLCHELKCL